ncbi:DUF4160 domain-containing protein [Bifidobacterium sp. MA2]|uniref:DUF4160 domain-containing protein n=1 Tax=Bifidobacterium santillanense TaxID=2809028 RepID=A0ABS5UQN4_9BIFI|nr:DUF4160 domain-containing protein [Bifidobacterium santillanense]MBT1173149.1 DUF4160 domain-containing protein [Bifidobacterium santillanense]
MPGLFRIHGFLIYFWANESNDPIHVHVAKGRQSPASAKFWILEDGTVKLAKQGLDMTNKEQQGITEFLRSVSPEIIMAWQEMFGYVRFHD